MYADLTMKQREKICAGVDFLKSLNKNDDPEHLAMMVANEVLIKTNKGLNGKIGSNAFATTITTLVMAKKISLV